MERPVSFDVTDYYPDGDEWSNDLVSHRKSMTGPSSPIHQVPEMENSEDATEYVIVTLDIHEDSVSVVSVTPVGNGGRSVEKNPDKNCAVERLANQPRRLKFESTEALKGLKMFINMTDSGWIAVEKRFYKMTAKTHGLLIRSKFGECVGINSEELALELFDTFARGWKITGEVICMDELMEFWCQINDKSFDSRLRMFFDMADKDGDGRLTKDKVREFIRLTALASNQSTMQKMSGEYATLIMEELDPDDLGYIIMEMLELLLLDVETLSVRPNTEETKKPKKRWHRVSSLISCLKK